MSGGFACVCKPQDRTKWRVVQYKCNHSKFNGSRYTPSRYSEVRCSWCLSSWRTTAAYVEALENSSGDEWEEFVKAYNDREKARHDQG